MKDLKDLEVKADYVNHKFHVWQDNHLKMMEEQLAVRCQLTIEFDVLPGV